MNNIFQAKDIQLLLSIAKIRYEYLQSKIGINPDIEEVEGTGRAHQYSFENLLVFAVANKANRLGLPPRPVKLVVRRLQEYRRDKEKDIFEIDTETDLGIFYIHLGELPVVFIRSSKDADFYLGIDERLRELEEEGSRDLEKQNFLRNNEYFRETLQSLRASTKDFYNIKKFAALLEKADGYLVINFGTIKKNLLQRI